MGPPGCERDPTATSQSDLDVQVKWPLLTRSRPDLASKPFRLYHQQTAPNEYGKSIASQRHPDLRLPTNNASSGKALSDQRLASVPFHESFPRRSLKVLTCTSCCSGEADRSSAAMRNYQDADLHGPHPVPWSNKAVSVCSAGHSTEDNLQPRSTRTPPCRSPRER